MLLTVFIFVLVLGLLIFVHEAGHFFAARSRGVRVEEFGFGFPPRALSIKRGETIYSLNWIPLGGFVKIFGEQGEGKGEKHSFATRGKGERFLIISAGVLMNVLLAFILFSGGYLIGLPVSLDDQTEKLAKEAEIRIVSVLPQTPAFKAGVKMGDRLEALDGIPFKTIPEVQQYLGAHEGGKVAFKFQRASKEIVLELVPEVLPETKKAGIGVSLTKVGIITYPFPYALVKGAEATAFSLKEIIVALFVVVKNLVFGKGLTTDISGPVGVAVMTGEMARMGFAYLIQFVALLSLNLAVINFLPFPALDGGRALFLALEALRRKPVPEKLENLVHNVGFILLLALVILVTYRDIVRWGGGFF